MTEQVPRELWRQGAWPHQATEGNEEGFWGAAGVDRLCLDTALREMVCVPFCRHWDAWRWSPGTE